MRWQSQEDTSDVEMEMMTDEEEETPRNFRDLQAASQVWPVPVSTRSKFFKDYKPSSHFYVWVSSGAVPDISCF